MKNRAHPFGKTESVELRVSDLARQIKGWLLDSEVRQLSRATIQGRKIVTDKLVWFLKQNECETCGSLELRQFLAYVGGSHEDKTSGGGRWGNPRLTKRVKPGTSATYHSRLKTFFEFLVDEGVLDASPMATMRAPVDRPDQIQPFNHGQIEALLAAAKKSRHPKRDTALLLFMLDTGVRVSELCAIRMADLDISGRSCQVEGKGGKRRAVYFGGKTTKALWAYLREDDQPDDAPLFAADGGWHVGEGLTRSGVLQLIRRLGRAAKIEAARCSPHTFRHTFAVEFLRNGGNQFTLMQLLGHSSLAMTARYLKLAQADMATQHRAYSPVDRMKGKGKERIC